MQLIWWVSVEITIFRCIIMNLDGHISINILISGMELGDFSEYWTVFDVQRIIS